MKIPLMTLALLRVTTSQPALARCCYCSAVSNRFRFARSTFRSAAIVARLFQPIYRTIFYFLSACLWAARPLFTLFSLTIGALSLSLSLSLYLSIYLSISISISQSILCRVFSHEDRFGQRPKSRGLCLPPALLLVHFPILLAPRSPLE